MIAFKVALALAIGLMINSPAQACQTPSAVIDTIKGQFENTSLYLRFSGARATDFVRRYNEMPPQTDHRADEILILKDPSFPRFYLIQLFFDGCLSGGGVLLRPVVDALLRASAGDPA